jgi:hypothetical protein
LGLQPGVGTRSIRHPWRSSYRGSDFGFDGPVLAERNPNASQKGIVPKDDKFKHQDRKESREASEAGGGNRAKKGGQEQKIKTVKVSQRGDIPGAARVSVYMFVLPADRPHGEPVQNTKRQLNHCSGRLSSPGSCSQSAVQRSGLMFVSTPATLEKGLPDNIVHIAGR